MNEELIENLKDISILCVEDEAGIREFVVNTLKYYFNEVYEASSGEEAYDVYLEYKPKIILTDIQMKNGNGIELVKKIRQKDLHTTIFMLTAHSNEEYLMDLINYNVNHFILKPLNHKKLTEALNKYVQANLSEHLILSEGIFLDVAKRELIVHDEHITLRKREKDFFQLLYENKNAITTYTQIEEELWLDKEMTIHALKSFIKELRGKLPVNIIKNVPQEGYILQLQA
jgi:DNA-binding response OmpR family regulator